MDHYVGNTGETFLPRFSSNSGALASELLEHLEEMWVIAVKKPPASKELNLDFPKIFFIVFKIVFWFLYQCLVVARISRRDMFYDPVLLLDDDL